MNGGQHNPIATLARLSGDQDLPLKPPGICRAEHHGFSFSGCLKKTSPPWTEVWRGVNPQGWEVAVKVPAPDASDLDICLRQMRREAQLLGDTTISGLASPIHFESAGDESYLVTKYAGDLDIVSYVRLSKLTGTQVYELVRGVAEITASLHKAGYTHGDLKPDHILIGADGRPTLIDFGMAEKWHEPEDGWAGDYLIGGSPGYTAPELSPHAQGGTSRRERPHPRQDVYALGMLLRDVLESANITEPRLERVLEHAADDSPGRRYQDAGEMLAAMQSALVRWRRIRIGSAIAGVTAAAILTVVLVVISQPKPIEIRTEADVLPYGAEPYGKNQVYLAHLDPDSGALAWVTWDARLYVMDRPGAEPRVYALGGLPASLDLSPGGAAVAVVTKDGELHIRHFVSGNEAIVDTAEFIDAKFSATGDAVYGWSRASSVVVEAGIDGTVLDEHHVEGDRLLWDVDDRGYVFVVAKSSSGPSSIHVVELGRGTVANAALPPSGLLTSADYDVDDGTMAIGSAKGVVYYTAESSWSAIELRVTDAVQTIHVDGFAAVSGELFEINRRSSSVIARMGRTSDHVDWTQLIVDEQSATMIDAAGVRLWDR